MTDLGRFLFDSLIGFNRVRAMEMGLPDPHPTHQPNNGGARPDAIGSDAGSPPLLIYEVPCPYCRGSGYSPIVTRDSAGEQGEKCFMCAGKGYVLTEG
jgi:hypothetical protein